jgi:hypothetical protein
VIEGLGDLILDKLLQAWYDVNVDTTEIGIVDCDKDEISHW